MTQERCPEPEHRDRQAPTPCKKCDAKQGIFGKEAAKSVAGKSAAAAKVAALKAKSVEDKVAKAAGAKVPSAAPAPSLAVANKKVSPQLRKHDEAAEEKAVAKAKTAGGRKRRKSVDTAMTRPPKAAPVPGAVLNRPKARVPVAANVAATKLNAGKAAVARKVPPKLPAPQSKPNKPIPSALTLPNRKPCACKCRGENCASLIPTGDSLGSPRTRRISNLQKSIESLKTQLRSYGISPDLHVIAANAGKDKEGKKAGAVVDVEKVLEEQDRMTEANNANSKKSAGNVKRKASEAAPARPAKKLKQLPAPFLPTPAYSITYNSTAHRVSDTPSISPKTAVEATKPNPKPRSRQPSGSVVTKSGKRKPTPIPAPSPSPDSPHLRRSPRLRTDSDIAAAELEAALMGSDSGSEASEHELSESEYAAANHERPVSPRKTNVEKKVVPKCTIDGTIRYDISPIPRHLLAKGAEVVQLTGKEEEEESSEEE